MTLESKSYQKVKRLLSVVIEGYRSIINVFVHRWQTVVLLIITLIIENIPARVLVIFNLTM